VRTPGACIVAYCLIAVGCAGPLVGGSNSELEQIGPYPANYKQVFAAYIQRAFYDPAALRDVAISAPVQGKLSSIPGWLVCLQTNAKNRAGKYEGPVKRTYLIRNGTIADVLMKAPFCDTATLQPWPEAESKAPPKP
jgi:hypothetical protein